MEKIVIVDDDHFVVDTLTAVIAQFFPDCVVYKAFDGFTGMSLVKLHQPDLIILDINLPSTSGHVICQHLKADPKLEKIPILIVTGSSSESEDKVKSLESGAEAFLNKPFDVEELVAQIRSLFRLKKAEDKLLNERDSLKIDVDLKNKQLEKNLLETKMLFNSFVEVMATAIDSLSDYNYNSTKRVAEMMKGFVSLFDEIKEGVYSSYTIDDQQQENMVTAAWLHDIGKMFVPPKTLNKYTRLGDSFQLVEQRMETIYYWLLNKNQDDSMIAEFQLFRDLVTNLNHPFTAGNDENCEKMKALAQNQYQDYNGSWKTWLTDYEVECLCLQNGTVTEIERDEIRAHVEMTDFLLSKISFPQDKTEIREWCHCHHEFLDGSGYSQGLKEEQIPFEARILTIIDIFEALTSKERPYKGSHNPDEAFVVLADMVRMGKLDRELLKIFKKSKVWENV
jgi:response regulator RpfG family c-di-GMP phosphodiesterase